MIPPWKSESTFFFFFKAFVLEKSRVWKFIGYTIGLANSTFDAKMFYPWNQVTVKMKQNEAFSFEASLFNKIDFEHVECYLGDNDQFSYSSLSKTKHLTNRVLCLFSHVDLAKFEYNIDEVSRKLKFETNFVLSSRLIRLYHPSRDTLYTRKNVKIIKSPINNIIVV